MKRFLPHVLILAGIWLCSLSAFEFAQAPAARAQTPTATAAPNDPTLAGLIEALPTLDEKARRGLALQVALDQSGFSPGEIDGTPGTNTDRAMAAFKAAKGDIDLGGVYSHPVATYTISSDDVAGPFIDSLPEDMMEKSKLPALTYTSVIEMLGERFHSSPKLLRRLNPNATFKRGEVIVVPNLEPFMAPGLKTVQQQTDAAPARTGTTPPPSQPSSDASRAPSKVAGGPFTITVTDRTKSLDVQNAAGEVVFHAPVTVGSENDPLPVGEWKVTGVSRNPVFNYNPKLFWDADASHAKARIPSGPNNPVGVVWIDLSKEHYGIHGTPEPSRIGYTESHGCIRLTNWDAVRLADLVSAGSKVILR